ncbi:alpha/beta hydrolase [Nonomuraea sp. NPDC052129]|uniref:alpha/beta hydrolase n=1 Tax=Nonomuraea sp. NPDC052129 TaxID=3154651 RepID=UPI00341708CD
MKWCDKTASCALHGKNIRTFWADLLARADRGELHYPGQPDTPLTKLLLIYEATGGFFGPDYREYAAHLASSRRFAPDMQAGPEALATMAACLGQRAPILNPQHRLRVSSPTILVANALHDPATGYNWAVSTAQQLGRAGRLFTYEGWGHRIYDHGECAVNGIDRYLVSLEPPAAGARCPAIPPTSTKVSGYKPLPGPVPGLPGWVKS